LGTRKKTALKNYFLLLLVLSIFGAQQLRCQTDSCVFEIPTRHIQIEDEIEIGGGAKDYVLCEGARVTVASGMHRFFVQAGAELEIVGGSPQVFAEQHSKVVVTRGTPRLSFGHRDVVVGKDKRGVSISKECELVFLTSNASSCLSIPPIVMDTVELIPAMDTALVMANLLADTRLLTTKKRMGSGKHIGPTGEITLEEKLPNNLTIVHQDTVLIALKRSFLLTKGETEIQGDKNKVYIQGGTIASLKGESNTIYALKGSSLCIDGNQENTIYFEKGAFVEVTGDGRAFKLIEHQSISFE